MRTIIRTINLESNQNCVKFNQETDLKSTRTIAEDVASSYQGQKYLPKS